MEYKPLSIEVGGFTTEKKMKVQDAFFKLGYKWQTGGESYSHLDANRYTNIFTAGQSSFYLFYGNSSPSGAHLTYQVSYDQLMELAGMKETPKSLLKNGCTVKLRSGRINRVFNGCLWTGDNTYMSNRFGIDKNYSDNLYKGRGNYSMSDPDDIMEIQYHGEVVWERGEEKTRLTMKELAVKLGVPVEKLEIIGE